MEVPMKLNEKLVIILRDCFTGGYTLPQYCIDNGIKKPLFVSEKKFLRFMWEVHVQFKFDKRLIARFSFLDLPTDSLTFSVRNTIGAIKFKNISEINPADFDAIILLTTSEVKISGKVISFSELTEEFIRRVYAEIPALNFLQRHPQVKLFYTKLPNLLSRYEGGEKFAKTIPRRNRLVQAKIKEGGDEHVPTPLDKFGYTNREFLTLCEVGGKITTCLDGTTIMTDDDNPLTQIKDGKRLTADQPEKFLNRIYFLGPCHFTGAWTPFDKTIESYLQKMLNEKNLPYRVENESQRFTCRYQDMFYNLNKLEPAPGDIVFLWISGNLRTKNLPVMDLSDAFDPPLDYREFFSDRLHFNELGYKTIAEKFLERLTENNFFRDVEFNYHTPPRYITDMVYLRNSRQAA